MEQLLPFALIAVVMYLLLIRPQQRKVKDQQRLIRSIEVGDEVVTIGGMFGTVTRMDEGTLWLQVADGTEIRFARQAIGRKIVPQSEETEEVEGEPSQDPE